MARASEELTRECKVGHLFGLIASDGGGKEEMDCGGGDVNSTSHSSGSCESDLETSASGSAVSIDHANSHLGNEGDDDEAMDGSRANSSRPSGFSFFSESELVGGGGDRDSGVSDVGAVEEECAPAPSSLRVSESEDGDGDGEGSSDPSQFPGLRGGEAENLMDHASTAAAENVSPDSSLHSKVASPPPTSAEEEEKLESDVCVDKICVDYHASILDGDWPPLFPTTPDNNEIKPRCPPVSAVAWRSLLPTWQSDEETPRPAIFCKINTSLKKTTRKVEHHRSNSKPTLVETPSNPSTGNQPQIPLNSSASEAPDFNSWEEVKKSKPRATLELPKVVNFIKDLEGKNLFSILTEEEEIDDGHNHSHSHSLAPTAEKVTPSTPLPPGKNRKKRPRRRGNNRKSGVKEDDEQKCSCKATSFAGKKRLISMLCLALGLTFLVVGSSLFIS